MYGEARADRLKHQTTRKYLDRKFEPYEKKKSIFSVSLSHKKKRKKNASEYLSFIVEQFLKKIGNLPFLRMMA